MKKTPLAAIILLALVPLSGVRAADPVKEAERFIGNKNYQQARTVLSKAIARHPENLRARELLFEVYLLLDQFQEAKDENLSLLLLSDSPTYLAQAAFIPGLEGRKDVVHEYLERYDRVLAQHDPVFFYQRKQVTDRIDSLKAIDPPNWKSNHIRILIDSEREFEAVDGEIGESFGGHWYYGAKFLAQLKERDYMGAKLSYDRLIARQPEFFRTHVQGRLPGIAARIDENPDPARGGAWIAQGKIQNELLRCLISIALENNMVARGRLERAIKFLPLFGFDPGTDVRGAFIHCDAIIDLAFSIGDSATAKRAVRTFDRDFAGTSWSSHLNQRVKSR